MRGFAAFVALCAIAPLLHGVMQSLKARLQGRPGPSPLQPYRDLAKLWQKETLVPGEGMQLFALAPGFALGSALTLAAAVVWAGHARPPLIDVVALIFVMALGRAAVATAALEVGSSFTGMAAARDAAFSVVVEPALLFLLLGGAAAGSGTGVEGLTPDRFDAASVTAITAAFLTVLAEAGRIPFDTHDTHYELTMIHEGLSLEYSGSSLALLHAAAYVRQASLFILVGFLVPPIAGWWTPAAVAGAIAVVVPIVENAYAKARLFAVPQLLASALVLAVAAVALRFPGLWPR
jgi:formate hydrogenlyase subunit 4